MRLALVLAGLLVIAPAVNAQQSPLRSAAPAVEAHRIPERAAAPEWTRPAAAELERAEAQAEAETPAALAQPTRTSWWWLVAAMVVAGVIVVAIT